jgi:hypothetical protein
MSRSGFALLLVVALTCTVARAGDSPGDIAWTTSLSQALAEARESRRPTFVAVNNVIAEGEGVEVASKLLREEVYTDPRIVELSKAFVCVLLRSPVSTEDGGELRTRFAIEGMIVTPQHLFLQADGTLIHRKEYWSPRDRKSSVEALATLMGRALKAHQARQKLPPLGSDAASRAAWIQAAVDLVRSGPDGELRRAAARELATTDERGDCLRCLPSVLLGGKEPAKEDSAVFVEVVRILGRPKLDVAVPGLAAMLDAKDTALRSNAAVSLEYVGASKALEALLRRYGKERDEDVKSNLLRALGRCGAKDDSVRKTLLKEASAKSDFVAAGAIIGLAYFERDPEVARGLERTLKGNDDGVRRVATLWTLVRVGDAKTAEVLAAQRDGTAEVLPSHRLLDAAASRLSGDEDRQGELDQALRWALVADRTKPETARSGRAPVGFVPLGDFGSSTE